MNPAPLTADDFSAFFQELWGPDRDPFPWQNEFARRLCAGQAPGYVAVPTGCGKTACIDAAIFALAVQAASPMHERTQGRRIFFIVNRRVIVDEAYDRAKQLCTKLLESDPKSITGKVAAALRTLSGEPQSPPLARAQLRGGIYRDRSWATSLVQPMIICSTVDQVGSRLLFRGYGVSPQARPIQAALVAQDSFLIIDEAHISRPFIQTLEWVERYRLHKPVGAETVHLPFHFIQMTATPPANTRDDQKITLTPEDYEHPVLKPRLTTAKPARLVIEPNAKGKVREERMAKRLAEEAENILTKNQPRSIAIMVNRVATARSVAEILEKKRKGRVHLLIGRLRPLDREAVTQKIQESLKTDFAVDGLEVGPHIVVSTQCLEVGADLDFDALVTEAASLDALRQRFGRLNRGGRDIIVKAVIVLPSDQDVTPDKLDDNAPCDPIYGNAITLTWRWLNNLMKDGVVDFGVNAMATAVNTLRAADSDSTLTAMLSPTANAPVLLPAYLDCWAQTHPSPAADPDIALFLHGPQRETADVQVCWRGDLPEVFDEALWTDTISLCPPTANECLPVPIHVFRKWIGSQGRMADLSSDFEETSIILEREGHENNPRVAALIWLGPTGSHQLAHLDDISPGNTIVLRAQDGGWRALGILPSPPEDPSENTGTVLDVGQLRRVDITERAAQKTLHRAVLRIHRNLWRPRGGSTAAALLELSTDPNQDWRHADIQKLLEQMLTEEATDDWSLDDAQIIAARHLANLKRPSTLLVAFYPGNAGFVLSSCVLMNSAHTDNFKRDDLDPEALLEASKSVDIGAHTRDVIAKVEASLSLLPLDRWREALISAAAVHDWGKVDPRFQALLRGASPFAVMSCETLLAKSSSIASSAAARRVERQRAELPEGFRHEMLSVLMAEDSVGATSLPTPLLLRDLALHLVATHHGYGRPFAPVVDDNAPPDVSLPINGSTITVTGTERLEHPAHALDSGLVERFWKMNRHYGWWGIALLESVLRLADQNASAYSANP